MTPKRPKVVEVLAKDETKTSKTMAPLRAAIIPSQNWVALQKSLSPTTSRKRKRESKPSRQTSNPTYHPATEKKGYTTYDPWHPNESELPRGTGHPSLIQLSDSGEVTTKYDPPQRINPDTVVI